MFVPRQLKFLFIFFSQILFQGFLEVWFHQPYLIKEYKYQFIDVQFVNIKIAYISELVENQLYHGNFNLILKRIWYSVPSR